MPDPEGVTVRSGWLPWREAWQSALYGPGGFYRSALPHQHFRTSVHASSLFSLAIVQLVRRHHLTHVIDYGAGSGELLRQIAGIAPDLRLTGIELRPRPSDLPPQITWVSALPEEIEGLLLANELLDNVPCDVIGRDAQGRWRIVEVDVASGNERLGDLADETLLSWARRWWRMEESERIEVGLSRDQFWAQACARLSGGVSLAIDYGHLQDYRPAVSTLRSYHAGREVPLGVDGTRDVTGHVAIDSVAGAVGASTDRQRDMLRDLGLASNRPDITLATSDPAGYVHALSMASEAGELVASPGLGDLLWILRRHS